MKRLVLVLATFVLLSLASFTSADCGGSCTYYTTGSNLLMSWNMDLQCQGKFFSYSGATANYGSFSQICGSASVSCVQMASGQMSWLGSGRPTLTSATIQGIYGQSTTGTAIGNRIQCNAVAPPQPPPPQPPQPQPPGPQPPGPQPPGPQPPGPQPPGPQPPGPQPPTPTVCPPASCSSITISRASSSDPLAGRSFNANCVMNICGANSYGCPSDAQWSASYGSVNPSTGGSTFWTQSGTSTVTISASVPACGTTQTTYDPATCTLSLVRPNYWTAPQQTSMAPGAYTNPTTGREFQAICSDQYGETFACPGPITWTSTAGSFLPSPFHSSADYAYWLASGTPASPVTITATSPTCGSNSATYALPVCTAVALNPRPLARPALQPDLTRLTPVPIEDLNFSLQCNDQYSERYPCPAAPTWTIQSGTLTSATFDADSDTYFQIWNATSVFGPFMFSATVPGCATTNWQYRPPAVCAGLNLSYGPTTTEEFAQPIGYSSTGSQFQWSPNGLENYLADLPGKFWGYNWTYAWLNRPTPDWVPFRIFGAACNDQYGQPLTCPPRYWNATSGYFENTSSSEIPYRNNLPANAVVWRSGNHSERTNITAVIPYCAKNNLSFDLYVHNACRIVPDPTYVIDLCAQYPWILQDPVLNKFCNQPLVKLPNWTNTTFTALCRDDAGQWLNCLEPDFAWLDPNTSARVSSTQYWQSYAIYNESTGIPLWNWQASFMGNSVVTLNATAPDAFLRLSAGGPTHHCSTGIILGNPPFTCNFTVTNATPQAGQTIQGALSCRGLDGPAPCPKMDFFTGPNLLVQPTSPTTAAITALATGIHDVIARPADSFDPDKKSMHFNPISCNATINVTPSTTRCSILPAMTSFSSQSTDLPAVLNQFGHLEAVPDLQLDRPEARLAYSSDVFACGQDFDGGIRTQTGFLALDKTRFHESLWQPASPVTVVMKNLPYDEPPKLYVFDGFAPDAYTTITLGQDCVSVNRCTHLQFDAAAHTLTFQTTGFSSFATASRNRDDVIVQSLPPSVRFELDCPLPQIGQNKTRATAFLYVNGTPYPDAGMTLEFDLNDTYAFETKPQLIHPATGRHDFTVDTRYGGTYLLRAYSGNWTSNACRLDVFEEESTPIPELNEWLILLLFAASGWLAYGKKR